MQPCATPAIARRIKPHTAGRVVNQLKQVAEMVGSLPNVRQSQDPNDDFLLALCEAGRAEYLVTGDKSGGGGVYCKLSWLRDVCDKQANS